MREDTKREISELKRKIVCIKKDIAPTSVSTDGDYIFILPKGKLLTHVVVESTNSITFNIGTTLGGDEIYTDTISDGYEVISVDQYAYGSDLTLYFSGYSPESIAIKIYTQ